MSERKDDGGPAFPGPDQGETNVNIHEGMTLRQYAAIKLKVPESGTEWLDAMIRQSLRDELAAKAMQGLLVGVDDPIYHNIAAMSLKQSDNMLKERAN